MDVRYKLMNLSFQVMSSFSRRYLTEVHKKKKSNILMSKSHFIFQKIGQLSLTFDTLAYEIFKLRFTEIVSG